MPPIIGFGEFPNELEIQKYQELYPYLPNTIDTISNKGLKVDELIKMNSFVHPIIVIHSHTFDNIMIAMNIYNDVLDLAELIHNYIQSICMNRLCINIVCLIPQNIDNINYTKFIHKVNSIIIQECIKFNLHFIEYPNTNHDLYKSLSELGIHDK